MDPVPLSDGPPMLPDGAGAATAPSATSVSQVSLLVTEWRPLRRPGPLLAVLCFLAGVALTAGFHSALSATVVFACVPIVAFTARRRITLAIYASMAFLLHLTYWLATGAKKETRADERIIVAASELCLIVSFAASWFYPYQYSDARKAWKLDYSAGDCGLPALTSNARAHEDGANDAEGAVLTA